MDCTTACSWVVRIVQGKLLQAAPVPVTLATVETAANVVAQNVGVVTGGGRSRRHAVDPVIGGRRSDGEVDDAIGGLVGRIPNLVGKTVRAGVAVGRGVVVGAGELHLRLPVCRGDRAGRSSTGAPAPVTLTRLIPVPVSLVRIKALFTLCPTPGLLEFSGVLAGVVPVSVVATGASGTPTVMVRVAVATLPRLSLIW